MEPTVISIEMETLFNLVNQRSLYIADQVNPELNEVMIDKIPITNDEYDAFLVFVRRGAMEIFKKISRMAFDIDTPFGFIEDEDTGEQTHIVFKINIPEKKQQDIILNLAAEHIQRGLVAYVIMEWLRTKHLDSRYFELDLSEWQYTLSELSYLKNYSSRPKLPYAGF